MTSERNRTDVAIGFASTCSNCSRLIENEYQAGAFAYCSPMCRDTHKRAARTEFVCAWCGVKTIEPVAVDGTQYDGLFCSHRCIDRAEAATKCSIVGCEVCSGAMRVRKGDANG
jgi:hypothetical protein